MFCIKANFKCKQTKTQRYIGNLLEFKQPENQNKDNYPLIQEANILKISSLFAVVASISPSLIDLKPIPFFYGLIIRSFDKTVEKRFISAEVIKVYDPLLHLKI